MKHKYVLRICYAICNIKSFNVEVNKQILCFRYITLEKMAMKKFKLSEYQKALDAFSQGAYSKIMFEINWNILSKILVHVIQVNNYSLGKFKIVIILVINKIIFILLLFLFEFWKWHATEMQFFYFMESKLRECLLQ